MSAHRTTRRAMLAGAANLSAAAAIGAGAAHAAPADDPIFAAIENHRRLFAAIEDAVHRNGRLRYELPHQKRQSIITNNTHEIFETDDPRWIASEREVFAGWDEVEDAAVELTDVQPTTLAGVTALLRYAGKIEAGPADAYGCGTGRPDSLCDDGDPNVHDWGAPFAYFIYRNAADAIKQIGGVS